MLPFSVKKLGEFDQDVSGFMREKAGSTSRTVQRTKPDVIGSTKVEIGNENVILFSSIVATEEKAPPLTRSNRPFGNVFQRLMKAMSFYSLFGKCVIITLVLIGYYGIVFYSNEDFPRTAPTTFLQPQARSMPQFARCPADLDGILCN